MKPIYTLPEGENVVAMTKMDGWKAATVDQPRQPIERIFVATNLHVYEIIGDKLYPLLLVEAPRDGN